VKVNPTFDVTSSSCELFKLSYEEIELPIAVSVLQTQFEIRKIFNWPDDSFLYPLFLDSMSKKILTFREAEKLGTEQKIQMFPLIQLLPFRQNKEAEIKVYMFFYEKDSVFHQKLNAERFISLLTEKFHLITFCQYPFVVTETYIEYTSRLSIEVDTYNVVRHLVNKEGKPIEEIFPEGVF
jgi:hypothetical protein